MSITYDSLPSPAVRERKRGRPSVVWIVPVIAIIAAIALGVRSYLSTGPTIRVSFESAEGLVAGKSEVRYKNVPIGRIEHVELSDDHQRIIAIIELDRGAADLAVADTQFWIERPRIGVGGVSGLGTLISGAYIGVASGVSKTRAKTFTGLERPPGATADQKGKRFRLTAEDAGSLAVRSPIYLRRVQVGWISDIALAPDGKSIVIEGFIQHPYEATVTTTTKFWNASGFDVTLDAAGFKLDTQSLASVVAGGLAYETTGGEPAVELATFELHGDHASALRPPDRTRVPAVFRFFESMRGIAAGSSIDFNGIAIGEVGSLEPGYDVATKQYYTDVHATVFPERMGDGPGWHALRDDGVARGLRAQIRAGNLLTGQGYIALAWFDDPAMKAIADAGAAWNVPAEPGGVDRLQKQIGEIVAKVNAIPFEAIGREIHATTKSANAFIAGLTGMTKSLDLNKDLIAPAKAVLGQVERAAYSLRNLADYLDRHPEALVRGRK